MPGAVEGIKFIPGAGTTVSLTVAVAVTCASQAEAANMVTIVAKKSNMYLVHLIASRHH